MCIYNRRGTSGARHCTVNLLVYLCIAFVLLSTTFFLLGFLYCSYCVIRSANFEFLLYFFFIANDDDTVCMVIFSEVNIFIHILFVFIIFIEIY